ncbi:dienelactone hydrolase family protein [Fulvimonas sp. R45]|uniref:dienelactone hydrolase family protein n=1 Tax=Fulvimonas sp. R45 TaxID=3045937 RepID=UPI00265D6BD9|nr:dienelactone hydrolase family protein [Fulvimonas sp. R45]MDO1528422.1 dienelactone hydrolase family protein [Fulvimonas sp. R45]
MPSLELTFDTRDGTCPATLLTPSGGHGPWPGVVFFMDGLGIRPALHAMARRLADGGYAVLLPDLYYRHGRYAPMEPARVFADPEAKKGLMALVGSLDRDAKITDAEAAAGFLSSRPEVKPGRLACTGYCMGGNIALTAAGAFPGRFAAIASFHGGGLATDDASSPHRHVQGITGRVYVAGADEDAHFTEAQKQLLEQALATAGIDHRVEIYRGAHHGYAVPDHPAFDEAAAERHWKALFALLDEALPH